MNSFETAAKDFLSHCRFEKNLSSKTIEAYSIDLRQFTAFLQNLAVEDSVSAIDKVILRQYLEHLSTWKPKTIKRKIACLKALFNYLEFDDVIVVNPFRKMRIRIKEAKQLPVQLSGSEIKRFLKAVYIAKASVTEVESETYANRTRDLAIVELLFATGIRVSELCSLKDKNIDFRSGTVQVVGKGNKERIIQIYHPEVKAALREYARLFAKPIKETGFFFINRLGKPISCQSIRFMVRNYTHQAKISKNVTPHTFRHTFATLLLEENVDIKYIQHFLGHSSILTTQIYTHVSKTKQRSILANKHPRKRFEMG